MAKIILQIHAASMMGQNPAAAVTLGFLRDNSGPKWTGAALTGTRLQNVTSFFFVLGSGGGGFLVPNEPFTFFFLSKFHLAAWASPCQVFYGEKVAPEISEAICAPAREPQRTHCGRFIRADSKAIHLNKDPALRKGK